MSVFFFFQAEDGIRDVAVTGVQTCALPICRGRTAWRGSRLWRSGGPRTSPGREAGSSARCRTEIGRASGRERGEISGGAGSLKKKKRRKDERRHIEEQDEHDRP